MTYSVVARDPDTGEVGIAVQTRNLAVGAMVPWVRAGVGAVATQGWTDVRYGYEGLDRMSLGGTPSEVLELLVADDVDAGSRQVAMINVAGDTAAHTGDALVKHSESVAIDDAVFAANMMRNEGVAVAMADSWAESAGEKFDERLLYALRAGQSAGGDLRGEQSAALKIAGFRPTPGWDGITTDLRVDDHPDPIGELSRLVNMQHAYAAADAGDALEALGDLEGAKALYGRAETLVPDLPDVPFWHGVLLAKSGDVEAAKLVLAEVFDAGDHWRELFIRLCDAGRLGPNSEALKALAAQ